MTLPRSSRVPCLVCGDSSKNINNKFCSNSCQMEHQYRQFIERWKAGHEPGTRGNGRNTGVSNHIKRYLLEKFGERCTLCGWDKRNPVTGRVPLNVEHKDGNPYNNAEGNLTLLCPNCHSLTPTYGALNKGKGRTMGS